ncbi:MAG: hypothetical protein EOP21_00440 [Hyphomicrobiales bacterium]|nr:MAG: hypothetical protein EOP21_00440 [Hyphomicrobiales bacterium]
MTGALALALCVLAGPAHGHEDPGGDVHPMVQVEDGKFVVYFRNNTEPKVDVRTGGSGQSSKEEPRYKTVLSPDGNVLEKRVTAPREPVQYTPSNYPEWMGEAVYGDPFGLFNREENKKPLFPVEWPGGKRPGDLNGRAVSGDLLFFHFTSGEDGSFRFGAYDMIRKKLLQSAVIGKPGRIYSFASASEVYPGDKEAWIAWIEERDVKRTSFPDGTADSYSSDTQLVVSHWNLTENKVTHLPIRQTMGSNTSLSLNRIGDHLLVAWHEGLGLYRSQIWAEHINLSSAKFSAELPFSPLPSHGLKSYPSP